MNVLLVAYYYPPMNSGGSERPFKFARYLGRFGHRVTVVSHHHGPPPADEPGTVRVRDPSHNWDRRGVGLVRWLAHRAVTDAANRLGVARSIYGPWRDRVLGAADALRDRAAADIVVATYPPVENLEIGLELAERWQRPLVADFRDGLMCEPVERDRLERHGCVRRHYREVEEAVARRAAAVVTAFPSVSSHFESAHRRAAVFTIPNGFDPDDYRELTPCRLLDPACFNIVHTGRFGGSYSGRDVGPLCRALGRVVRDDPALEARVRLHLVGPLERAERRLFAPLVAAGTVVPHGLRPRSEALACQLAADALLLVTSVDRLGNAPGKLFEYLYASRPILGLTAGSFSEQVIDETGTGWTVDPRDEAGIARLVRTVATDPAAAAGLARRDAAVAAYARDRQVRRLEEILHTVVAGRAG